MKASQIKNWPREFKASDWPTGTLDQMGMEVLTDLVFPLRKLSGVPMWPSAFARAHVRDSGNSMHSTKGGTRLSMATDMHVRNHQLLMQVFAVAQNMPQIGGIGLYFDTNTPMFHVDPRPDRLVWLRYKEGDKTVMLYRENNAVKFYKKLGELLCYP